MLTSSMGVARRLAHRFTVAAFTLIDQRNSSTVVETYQGLLRHLDLLDSIFHWTKASQLPQMGLRLI